MRLWAEGGVGIESEVGVEGDDWGRGRGRVDSEVGVEGDAWG